MKPSKVVTDTHEEQAERQRRREATDKLLERVERDDRARWPSATSMLSWFFALAGHMASAPAIDPAADYVQGGRVDRDERLAWIGSVRQALHHLEEAEGSNTGTLLLWLHLRPRRITGYKVRRGLRIPITSEPVPLWELHAQPMVQLGRRRAAHAYWAALRRVEDFAFAKGWIAARSKRKERAPNTYRRKVPDAEAEPSTP